MIPTLPKHIDGYLALGERTFNLLGWCPGISQKSGAMRKTAAQVMVVFASAVALMSYARGYFQNNDAWAAFGDQALIYIGHGLANWTRGAIEEKSGVIGNIGRAVYDVFPLHRFSYTNEGTFPDLLTLLQKYLEPSSK